MFKRVNEKVRRTARDREGEGQGGEREKVSEEEEEEGGPDSAVVHCSAPHLVALDPSGRGGRGALVVANARSCAISNRKNPASSVLVLFARVTHARARARTLRVVSAKEYELSSQMCHLAARISGFRKLLPPPSPFPLPSARLISISHRSDPSSCIVLLFSARHTYFSASELRGAKGGLSRR